jgi:hypothetical protein
VDARCRCAPRGASDEAPLESREGLEEGEREGSRLCTSKSRRYEPGGKEVAAEGGSTHTFPELTKLSMHSSWPSVIGPRG